MFWARVKKYLPRTLFGRAALIYFVPVLTILGVMSVVGSFLLILLALAVAWLIRTNRESRAAQN